MKIWAENDFHIIFVPSGLELWPLDLKFAPLVTLVQRHVSTETFPLIPLNYKFLRLSCFEKIEGTERTDGQTDGRGATINAAHARQVRTINSNMLSEI